MSRVGIYFLLFTVLIAGCGKKGKGPEIEKVYGRLQIIEGTSAGTATLTYKLHVHEVGGDNSGYLELTWGRLSNWLDVENNKIKPDIGELNGKKVVITGKIYLYCNTEYRLIDPSHPESFCFQPGDHSEIRLITPKLKTRTSISQ